MDINVYSNPSSVGATSTEPLYGNIPQNYDETDIQKDHRYTPAMSVREKNYGYERVDPPNTGANQLHYSDVGDFKLIHKSLTPSRNTARRYPKHADMSVSDDQNAHCIPDELIFQERNMNNMNTELEKECHHTNIFDKQSMRLNSRNVLQSPDDILESNTPQTGLTYQRFKPQIMYTTPEERFHCFLDFSQPGNETSEPRDEKNNQILQSKTDRTEQSQALSTQSLRTGSTDDFFKEKKGNTPAPLQITNNADEISRQDKDFHYLQSPEWRNTQMRDGALQNDDFDDEVVFKTHRCTKSVIEDDDDDDIVYHRKYMKRKNRQDLIGNDIDKANRTPDFKQALENNSHCKRKSRGNISFFE